MTIKTKPEALKALSQIRFHQEVASNSISPFTKAAEAEKAVTIAIDLIEFLITSGDAKGEPCQEKQ